jgi:hypothetical protein
MEYLNLNFYLKMFNKIIDKSLSFTFYYGIFIDIDSIRIPSITDAKSERELEYFGKNKIGSYFLPGKFATNFVANSKIKDIFSIFFGNSNKFSNFFGNTEKEQFETEKQYKKTIENILKLCTIFTYFMYLCPTSSFGILIDQILNYIFIDSSREILAKFIKKNNLNNKNNYYSKFCRLIFFFIHLYFIFIGKNIFTENQLNYMNSKIFTFINTLNLFIQNNFDTSFFNTQISLEKETLFLASTFIIDKTLKISTTKLSIYLAEKTRKYDNQLNNQLNNKRLISIQNNKNIIINSPSDSYLNFIKKSTVACINKFIDYVNNIFSNNDSDEYINNINFIINIENENGNGNSYFNNSFYSASSNLNHSNLYQSFTYV